MLMDPLQSTSPLLCDNNNIGLLLNVDWFKPFKYSEYKVSAMDLQGHILHILQVQANKSCTFGNLQNMTLQIHFNTIGAVISSPIWSI